MEFDSEDVGALEESGAGNDEGIAEGGGGDGLRGEGVVGNRAVGHVEAGDFGAIEITDGSVVYQGAEFEFGPGGIAGELEGFPEVGSGGGVREGGAGGGATAAFVGGDFCGGEGAVVDGDFVDDAAVVLSGVRPVPSDVPCVTRGDGP